MEIEGSELTQLIEITEQMKPWNAEPIEALIKLKKIRGRSLPKIMEDLGINPPDCL